MKSIWQDETRRDVSARLVKLDPARPAQWGRMSSQQMVCHLHYSLQMAIGERAVRGRWTPFRLPLLKPFVLYYAPFPKNAPTAPELVITATPNSWDRDVADLCAAMDRFVARGRGARWPDHPAFGPLTAEDWGVLVYRHTDHHLRQFGV
jgi:hypothetical protein